MSQDSDRHVLNSDTIIETLARVNISAFLDKWGPEEVLQVYDPETNMQGILVIDNTILGPSIGGVRISPTITPLEIFKLARIMTWKCSLAELPLGGAKAAIRANPYEIDKYTYIKAFAKKIAPVVPGKYIPGPDMNVRQEEMKFFVDEIGDLQAATGKPEKIGGIPCELGTAGAGMGIAIDNLLINYHDIYDLPDNISNAKIVIQGWGNLAIGIAAYLSAKGAKIVAINDLWGTIYDSKGIDCKTAREYAYASNAMQSVKNHRGEKSLSRDAIFSIDCDIFIPCASTYAINEKNWSEITAKLIVEGADMAVTNIAEKNLIQNNTIVLPDIIANAGGAIGSYAEHKRQSVADAFSMIELKITKSLKQVIDRSISSELTPREVAIDIAQQRILDKTERQSKNKI